ncbi:MAG: hypothetical protein ACYCW6_00075 [Candidatus Xenobia bacterium]
MAKIGAKVGFGQTTRGGLYLPTAAGVIFSNVDFSDHMEQVEILVGCSYYGTTTIRSDFDETVHTILTPTTTGSGSVSLISARNGQAKLDSGTTSTGSALLDQGGRTVVDPASDPVFECGIAHAATGNTQVTYICGLYDGTSSNCIDFQMSVTTSAADWFSRTVSGGVATTNDTGQAFSGTTQIELRMEITPTSVGFFVDDTLKATHGTNIPTALLQPRFYVVTSDTNDKQLLVDYFSVMTGR